MSRKWLAKSEPNNYSIVDLRRDKKTLWTGVRNYQARNLLRDEWAKGDEVLFYHSNAKPSGVYGLAKVTKAKVADPTQFDPKSDYYDPKAKKDKPTWFAPEITFVSIFKAPISIEDIKKDAALKNMEVLRKGSRLSVQPVKDMEYKRVLMMSEKKSG